MHAKPDLRVVLKWRIAGSGSVIAAVIPPDVEWMRWQERCADDGALTKVRGLAFANYIRYDLLASRTSRLNYRGRYHA